MLRRQPELKDIPFVLVMTERGRRVVKAVNAIAHSKGIFPEMVLADCKALVPELKIFDFDPEEPKKLLTALAEWCIRYAPFISVDLPDGIIMDVSGCPHLWNGEKEYIETIQKRFAEFGYTIRIAMADTIGTAWAVSRFGKSGSIITSGAEKNSLLLLPPAALRLEPAVLERLKKLGLKTIGSFIDMPSTALNRRFGPTITTRIFQALGRLIEITKPVRPISPYQEQLTSMEPIRTAPGIEIALQNLLEALCLRLNQESKGLRTCELRCYRVDGNIQKISIGCNRPSRNVAHLFKLFALKIAEIEPDLGIELFILEAAVVEELINTQDALWTSSSGNAVVIAELLDKIAGKTGADAIHRYLPAEHYWPERSVKSSSSLTEKPDTAWPEGLVRPMHLLSRPEAIEVSVPIPDYPPLLFKHRGVLHTVKKADGPERIEQEWWIRSGLYRDYYCVEDEKGARYWLFRSGDNNNGNAKWYLHGYFA